MVRSFKTWRKSNICRDMLGLHSHVCNYISIFRYSIYIHMRVFLWPYKWVVSRRDHLVKVTHLALKPRVSLNWPSGGCAPVARRRHCVAATASPPKGTTGPVCNACWETRNSGGMRPVDADQSSGLLGTIGAYGLLPGNTKGLWILTNYVSAVRATF